MLCLEFGEISLRVAYDVAHEPSDDQLLACADGANAVRDFAKRLRNSQGENTRRGTSAGAAGACPDAVLACELIDVGFRRLATEKHPDKPGGDTRTMQQLNALRDWLKATVNATV